MSLIKAFKTDESKVNAGVKVEFFEAENADGTIPAFYLARMSRHNSAYAKALETAMRPHKRKMQLGLLDEETALEITIDVFVKTILKNWENVQLQESVNEVFTASKAKEVLKALPDLFDRLQEEAREIENFKESSSEDEVKN